MVGSREPSEIGGSENMLMKRRYGTEKAVGKAIGRAIRDCHVPREELFVTTKLWNNKHNPNDVAQALQDSLNDLGLEYVDLFLMHYPVAWKQGDNLFPKDNGKPAVVDIDYVDVCIFNATTGSGFCPSALKSHAKLWW
jgi:diketogulonate reductase-like aldo/keto reductase